MKKTKKIGAAVIVLAVILSTGMCVLAADADTSSDETASISTLRSREGKRLLKHSGRKYCIFTDIDGDGICDNCRRHTGHHEGRGCHGRNIAGCTVHRDADSDNICDVCGIVLAVQEEIAPSDNLEIAGEYGACAYVDADGDGICDNCHQQEGHHANGNGGYGTCVYADEDGDGICDYCYQNADHHAYGNCGNMGGGYCVTHGDADGDGYCDICGAQCHSADVPADPQAVDPGGDDNTYGYGGYGCNPSGGGYGHHGGGHHGRGHH